MDESSGQDTKVYIPERRGADPQRRRLLIIWTLWVGMGILTLLIVVASLPIYANLLQTICTRSVCPDEQLTSAVAHALSTFGLSVSSYATLRISFSIIWMLVWFAVAALLVWQKGNEWYGLLVALMCLLLGAISVTNIVAQSPSPWQWLAILVNFLGFFLLFLVILLFPDGHFVPRWTRLMVVVYLLQSVSYNFFPSVTFQLTPWAPFLGDFLWIGILLVIVATQIYRYRHVSNAVQRQQTKWVVFGFAILFLSNIGATLLLLVLPPLSLASFLFSMAFGSDSSFILLFIPLSFGIAILRYRLWDIDLLINRTLVYSILTICIFGVYTLFVGYMGFLFQERYTLFASLLATMLVALFFQPLREWLQRSINKIMYGDRDDPYGVIVRLGQRLEATLAPDATLPIIVETVAQALKLPYAAIVLNHDAGSSIAARYGTPNGGLVHLPLVYQGEQLGELVLAPRTPGESFTTTDQRLLDGLARQAGVAAHTVHITMNLQRLMHELQRSREQLVTTREEERRRLRRDLHDGLGSVLTSLNWRAGAIRKLLALDPLAADALVGEQQSTVRSAIADIRRLVYELRPPSLDELGLIGAIQERAAQESTSGVSVNVVCSEELPVLSAAVEVAAYRITQEALVNVIRHAHAHRCFIHLEIKQGWLQVEIADDGIGLKTGYRAGVGLLSMRERAEELGGTCEISQSQGGGTKVSVSIPLGNEDDGESRKEKSDDTFAHFDRR